MELEKTGAEIAARFLALLFDALGSASTPLELAPRAAAAAAEATVGWCCLWLQDRATGELRLAAVAHHIPDKGSLALRLAEEWVPQGCGGVAGRVVGSSRAVSLSLDNEEKLLALFGSEERARLAAALGSASVLVTPPHPRA
ncbi:MAG: hypothetical protein M1380_06525 [Chloroflexi bacterium]|nr:hypothetical protein [Chloroflexota bacterium]